MKLAKVNKDYKNQIVLPKKSVIPDGLRIIISPKDSGLKWEPSEYKDTVQPIEAKDYNTIVISGKPNVTGEIYIDFSWSTYGSMIYSPKAYKKRYILKVEE
ncbi:hypothetical protein HYE59_00305 [Aggregatibacter actinomycetemcomitans]|uniref:hypothetical protein n=1 Tax=Aggregatibacter actinomycetemcomitans TaxID=714 RepID=UPI00197C2CE0|nr:hypothetical protein [Aggregatibacter actinomycetemcomitans]MBN6076031.1 hypothetical protein [Aggregatibacter actinomycetemcomitans]